MRPRGEIRQALFTAARELYPQVGAVSWVRLAEHAQVGYATARRTVDNMARSGELVRVGSEKPAGAAVWLTLFEPAEPEAGLQSADASALDDVVRTWAEFR